jgi:hypothetical protein
MRTRFHVRGDADDHLVGLEGPDVVRLAPATTADAR